MSNRILDYPEATAITSDDYILLDNADTGAKCIKASALNINMDNYTIKEARGAIASFDDGEDLPLAFMGAYITAIQDLHGYYYPWVGGSGKNLFNMGSKWSGSDSGLSFTTDDDYVTMNGTKSGANYVTPSQLYFDLPAGTYYAKAFVISGTASNKPSIYVYSNQELTSNMLNTGRSFTLESQTSVGIRFAFWDDGATYSNYKIGIVISKDADIDKFYPYSNICPISGWSAVDVNRAKVYQICEPSDSTEITANGVTMTYLGKGKYRVKGTFTTNVYTSLNLPIVPFTIYGGDDCYIKLNNSVGLSAVSIIFKNNTSQVDSWGLYPSNRSGSYVGMRNKYTNNITIEISSSGYGTNFDFTFKVEILSNSTANLSTYNISFGSAGTVYGGYVDVVSGVLTVDRIYKQVKDLEWRVQGGNYGRFFTVPSGADKALSDSNKTLIISDAYKGYSDTDKPANTNGIYVGSGGSIKIWDSEYTEETDIDAWKTARADVELCYYLATPLTYQLSKQQIRSLVGENNIFANTGDSIVDYRKIWVKPEM